MIQNKNHLHIVNFIVSHLAKIEIVPEAVIEVIWLDKLCLNCIFDFSPCNYSWICDGIKRDLLSSSSTYVDTMKRVKGEKFQHNFLASLWVFIFFPCSQTNQTFPIFDSNYCLCHSGPLMPHPCCYSCYMPWDICILIT